MAGVGRVWDGTHVSSSHLNQNLKRIWGENKLRRREDSEQSGCCGIHWGDGFYKPVLIEGSSSARKVSKLHPKLFHADFRSRRMREVCTTPFSQFLARSQFPQCLQINILTIISAFDSLGCGCVAIEMLHQRYFILRLLHLLFNEMKVSCLSWSP